MNDLHVLRLLKSQKQKIKMERWTGPPNSNTENVARFKAQTTGIYDDETPYIFSTIKISFRSSFILCIEFHNQVFTETIYTSIN
jgi:hypothetical protein